MALQTPMHAYGRRVVRFGAATVLAVSVAVGVATGFGAQRLPMAAELAELDRLRGDADGWLTLHVVHGRCLCSAAVIERLFRVPPRVVGRHVVVFVGEDETLVRALEARRFKVVSVTRTRFERSYHARLRSPPLVALVSPSGRLAHVRPHPVPAP